MKLLTIMMTALLLFATAANAAQVVATVVDNDGQPVVGASVVTDVSGLGTATDRDGRFVLNLTDEVTRLTFSAVGYQPRQLRIDDIAGTVVLKRTYWRGTDIVVSGNRAQPGVTPIAFDNLSENEIKDEYTVGEFPLLLETTPNLYSYSDAGTPLGYSYMKIRGFDDKRVVTYINGVPLNDPEDQATYFVDLPDFAANTTDIQVQRGVGNSLYGDASFGGSINIVTNPFGQDRKVVLTTGYGEYTHDRNTVADVYKQSIAYYSGLVDGRWAFSGRFSKQKSGGYRENSWYDGWAYYFSMARLDPNMTTQLQVYGGPMRMHLSYYGVTRSVLDKNYLFNPLGYDNDTDNFNQPHYQLTNTYAISDRATLTNTVYYIRGKGYYEQLKTGESYSEYDLLGVSDSTGGNVVRQQWVEKNQWGWNPRLDIKHDRGSHTLGGSLYLFESDHWGQVVWAEHINASLDPRHVYYRYFGKKLVGSAFGQETYELTDKLSAQVVAQLRYQRYSFDQEKIGAFAGYTYDLDWFFFSPRVGLNYRLGEHTSLFGNFSVASRTPTDVAIYEANDPTVLPSLEILSIDSTSTPGERSYDFGDPTAKSERVYDFELGGDYHTEEVAVGINLFWMDFKDEIIPYGGVSEDGILITTNAERSVHAGVELAGAVSLGGGFEISGNFAYNRNRIKDHFIPYSVDSSSIDGVDTLTVTVDRAANLKDNTIPGFPELLGNLTAGYETEKLRIAGHFRLVGKQYSELLNSDSLAIDPYSLISISGRYTFSGALGLGDLTLLVKIDNLIDKKHETSSYGWSWWWQPSIDGPIERVDEAEYYIGPGRSFYGQLQLELF